MYMRYFSNISPYLLSNYISRHERRYFLNRIRTSFIQGPLDTYLFNTPTRYLYNLHISDYDREVHGYVLSFIKARDKFSRKMSLQQGVDLIKSLPKPVRSFFYVPLLKLAFRSITGDISLLFDIQVLPSHVPGIIRKVERDGFFDTGMREVALNTLKWRFPE